MGRDEWSQHRSYLNHTEFCNGFRWALTPDREDYAEAAVKGVAKEYADPDEQADFEETKKRIDGWPALRTQMLEHAQKITSEFNPYVAGFEMLRFHLSSDDISWLQEIVKADMVSRFKLNQWQEDVAQSVRKIDSELIKVREGKSTVKELRSAADTLKDIFSGRGYFNYGKSI